MQREERVPCGYCRRPWWSNQRLQLFRSGDREMPGDELEEGS